MYDSWSHCTVIENICFPAVVIISKAALWSMEEKTSDYKVDK